MEELIKFLNIQILKIDKYLEKHQNNLQRAHYFGMIDAYNRIIYEIELNGVYLEKEERKNILQSGYNACCGKTLNEKSIELYFKSNEL